MKIVMKKIEWLDDCYLIVKAEHDGREWMERIGPNRTVPASCAQSESLTLA